MSFCRIGYKRGVGYGIFNVEDSSSTVYRVEWVDERLFDINPYVHPHTAISSLADDHPRKVLSRYIQNQGRRNVPLTESVAMVVGHTRIIPNWLNDLPGDFRGHKYRIGIADDQYAIYAVWDIQIKKKGVRWADSYLYNNREQAEEALDMYVVAKEL